MELKQIKELMATMGRTGTKRLMIEEEGFKLELERHEAVRPVSLAEMPEDFAMRHAPVHTHATLTHMRGHEFHPPAPHHPSPKAAEEVVSGIYITSPMVGTFYASPSPEDGPYIKVGDRVQKQQVVCIIEAMKVMNEVKAGVDGSVVEVLVENGQPVEFGTKLFRIS